MSQWTHIRGSLELRSNPYEYKGNKTDECWEDKKIILPFPEEQMKIAPATPTTIYKYDKDGRTIKDSGKPGLEFRAYLFSLPKMKKYITEAFKMLPQGESGLCYSLYQDMSMVGSSSSGFNHSCEEKAFKNQLSKIYTSSGWYEGFPYKYLTDMFGMTLDWIEHVNAVLVGIRDDIRYCSGEELLEGLEKAFLYLLDNDIKIEDGYLEWEDEYTNDQFLYAWRRSRVSPNFRELFGFYKLDRATNRILWSKTYLRPLVDNPRNENDVDYRSTKWVIEEKEANPESVSEKSNDEISTK